MGRISFEVKWKVNYSSDTLDASEMCEWIDSYTGWDGAAMVPVKVVKCCLEERLLLVLFLRHVLSHLLFRIHHNFFEIIANVKYFSGCYLLFLVGLAKRCDQHQLLLERNWPILQTFARQPSGRLRITKRKSHTSKTSIL